VTSPEKGTNPVELASGAEKTLISLAFRAVMWSISSLPKVSMLILDETFGALEEDSLGLTMKMLEYLKNYFEYIFVITHDASLKGGVDNIIYIEKDSQGYSHVEI
jgi:exonuclease SbcC